MLFLKFTEIYWCVSIIGLSDAVSENSSCCVFDVIMQLLTVVLGSHISVDLSSRHATK